MAGPVAQGNLPIPPTPDSITPEWLTAALRGSGTVENAKVLGTMLEEHHSADLA
jgi:hypothetical protein